MKYFIYAKDDPLSQEIAKYVLEKLNSAKSVFGNINDSFVYTSKDPSFIISIGGDGTLLRAFHQFFKPNSNPSLIGIHTGKLGFFCDVLKDQVNQLIDNLIKYEPSYTSYRTLALEYDQNMYYAINEVRLENPYTTMISQVYIDDKLLEVFRGNGLNFSTALGSSAYNRSLNGPLVDPELEVILMSEVAGITHNAYRSLKSVLVLPGNHKIKLKGNFKRCLIGHDHLFYNVDESKSNEILIELTDEVITLMHYQTVSYIDRLRSAFIAD